MLTVFEAKRITLANAKFSINVSTDNSIFDSNCNTVKRIIDSIKTKTDYKL